MKRFPAFIIPVIISVFIAGSACAQEIVEKKIEAVRVKNNKSVNTAVILSKVRTKPGDTFSQDVLNDDLKRLYGLGFFTDISIDVSDYKDGVEVSFIVEEKPLIGTINIEGNKGVNQKLIKKEISSKEGDMFDPARLSQDVNAIRRLYEKRGYHLADISYTTKLDEKKNVVIVTIMVNEYATTKIKHVFLEGNEEYPDKKIMSLIMTRPDTLFSSGHFKEDVFEEDLKKIKAFYQNEGYLDIELKNDTEYYNNKKFMDITIIIDEGKKYLVGDITATGNNIFTDNELNDVLKLTRNKPFSQDGMRFDAAHIQEIYYNKGYIMCRVYPEPIINKSTGRIDIKYSINEDKMIYVNKVNISGNTKTKDVVIRRDLRIYPGEPFSGAKIKRSKEKLYNLGYFEEISFDTSQTGDPEKRDLEVKVKETKTGEFSFGGGYSSVDRLIGFTSISQKNFDIMNFPTFTGGGQNLTLRGEFGFVRSNYVLSWTDPWIFGYPYLFGFDLYRTTHERETDVGYGWEEERWGGSTRLGKDFTDWLKGRLIYKFDRVKISDLPDDAIFDIQREEGSNYLSSLGAYLTFDTRDNVFNPKRGVLISGGVQEAGGPFMGDFDFLKYTASANHYTGFADRFVLELKARAGMVGDYGDSDHVPIYERFYAGGGSSIRGYSERGVGPRDAVREDPIGGESILIGNAEISFPIYKDILKGAVFYDIGNVWEEMEDIGQGDYKYGTGVGVRVKTPIGPVKVDWGYPLKEIDEEKQRGRFYFSMSHGF